MPDITRSPQKLSSSTSYLSHKSAQLPTFQGTESAQGYGLEVPFTFAVQVALESQTSNFELCTHFKNTSRIITTSY